MKIFKKIVFSILLVGSLGSAALGMVEQKEEQAPQFAQLPGYPNIEECILPYKIENMKSLAFGSDGTLLAFGLYCPIRDNVYKNLYVFDVCKQEFIAKVDLGEFVVEGVALSPDGKRLAVVSRQKGFDLIKILDIRTGGCIAELKHENYSLNHPVFCDGEMSRSTGDCFLKSASFSPDGESLILNVSVEYMSASNFVEIWDIKTGKCIAKLKRYISSPKALSCDGRYLVSFESDHVCVLDVGTGELVKQFWKSCASMAGFSPDGELLAVGSHLSIEIYDLKIKTMFGEHFARLVYKNPVKAVAFSLDGLYFAVSEGGNVHLYKKPQQDLSWKDAFTAHN